MIDFSSGYSYAEILAAMLGQVDDSLDKRQGSLIQTALGPGAWYLEGMMMDLSKIQQNAYVLTAQGEALDLGVANRGLTRKPATAAVRRGTFNVAIPSGSEFKTINGSDSVVFISGEMLSGDFGVYVYEMTCETPGEIGNSYSGDLLPITAIAGLTTATIGEIITVGAEEESDNALKTRYVESFTTAPYGGNMSEYRQAILAIPGVGGVQVYGANAYNGGGTVLCSIISDEYGAASSALVATVQETICPYEADTSNPSPNGYGIAPIGAAVTITSATELPINITADIDFLGNVENGIATYGDEIKAAIGEYITTVAQDWGKQIQAHQVSYPVTVYVARIIYAILSVDAVANVRNVTLNGGTTDLNLTESAALQQVPVLGEVTLNEY